MRYEDTAAIRGFEFGTFTNHQLSFQTNDTRRMTIDTGGRTHPPHAPKEPTISTLIQTVLLQIYQSKLLHPQKRQFRLLVPSI